MENSEIKAWIEGKKDNSRKERTLEGFAGGEESQEKEREERDQSTKETHQKTKEPRKTKENEISDTASSCTRTKKTESLRGKKSVRIEDEMQKTKSKVTKKFFAEDLEERLIVEVAKRVGGVQGYYPTSRAVDAMEGIVKTPFTSEIEKEERPKDFSPPTLDKYEGT